MRARRVCAPARARRHRAARRSTLRHSGTAVSAGQPPSPVSKVMAGEAELDEGAGGAKVGTGREQKDGGATSRRSRRAAHGVAGMLGKSPERREVRALQGSALHGGAPVAALRRGPTRAEIA